MFVEVMTDDFPVAKTTAAMKNILSIKDVASMEWRSVGNSSLQLLLMKLEVHRIYLLHLQYI